jgi:hypothetical protein
MAALSVAVSGDLDDKIIYLLTEQAATAQIYRKKHGLKNAKCFWLQANCVLTCAQPS